MEIHDGGIARTGDDMFGSKERRDEFLVGEVGDDGDVAAFDAGIGAGHETLDDEDGGRVSGWSMVVRITSYYFAL